MQHDDEMHFKLVKYAHFRRDISGVRFFDSFNDMGIRFISAVGLSLGQILLTNQRYVIRQMVSRSLGIGYKVLLMKWKVRPFFIKTQNIGITINILAQESNQICSYHAF